MTIFKLYEKGYTDHIILDTYMVFIGDYSSLPHAGAAMSYKPAKDREIANKGVVTGYMIDEVELNTQRVVDTYHYNK